MNEGHSHGRKTIFLILAGVLLLVLVLLASFHEDGPITSIFATPTFNKTWGPFPTQDIDECYIDDDGRLMSRFGDDYARYAFWLDDGKLGVTGISQSYGFYGDWFEYYYCYVSVDEPGLITEFDGSGRFISNSSNLESLLSPYVDLDKVVAAAYSEEYQKIIYQRRNAEYALDCHDSTEFHMFYPYYDLWEVDLKTSTERYVIPKNSRLEAFQPELVSWIDESHVYLGKNMDSSPMFPTFVDLEAGKELFFGNLCYYDSKVDQIHLSTVRNQVLLITGGGVLLYDLVDMNELGSHGDRHSCYDRDEFSQFKLNGTWLPIESSIGNTWPIQWGDQSGNIYFLDPNAKSGTFRNFVRYSIEDDTTELLISREDIQNIFPEDEHLRFAVSPDEKFVAFYTYWYSKIYVAEIND